jgi:soluble lytic murein transglycosylase-like protein
VIAFAIGMIISAFKCNALDEQHQQAVEAGAIIVYAAEPEQYELVSDTTTTTTATTTTTQPTTTAPKRKYFDVPLTHPVQDHIFAECEEHNIQPAVIVAMIERESDFDIYCLGDDGRAAGLMQIQAKWHLKRMIALDSTDLFDPYQNITVGIDYLAELLDKYDGNIAKALVAYNQGSYKGTITNYAKSILNNAEELK